MALNMALVMDHPDSEFHGRVMSVSLLTFPLVPLSVMPTGAPAHIFGHY